MSRTETFLSFPRLLLGSGRSSSELGLASRVRTLESPVELFSLLIAAASRSGHSERLTNSNCGSAALSTLRDKAVLGRPIDTSGRDDSRIFGSSADCPGAVSLKSWSVAATLRPMPAFAELLGGKLSSWPDEVEEDVDDTYDALRNRGRAVFGGETIGGRSIDEREAGIVRDRAAFFCEGRLAEGDCGASRSCLFALTEVSESVPLSLACCAHCCCCFTVCEGLRRKTGCGEKYCSAISGSLGLRALRRGDECAVTVAELGGEGGKVKSGCLECFAWIAGPIDSSETKGKTWV